MDSSLHNAREADLLYSSLGAIIVASGHIEFRVKRLLAAIRGHTYPDLGKARYLQWSELAKSLRSEASNSIDEASLLNLMREEPKINSLRNHVVHGCWRLDMGPPTLMREYKNEKKEYISVTLAGPMDDLLDAARRMFEFADQLEILSNGQGCTPFPIVRPSFSYQ